MQKLETKKPTILDGQKQTNTTLPNTCVNSNTIITFKTHLAKM